MKAGGLKPLAYLAAAGIITNLVLFLGSFFGCTATNTLPVIVICGVLLLGLDLPMWFDPSLPISKFFYFWGAFWIGKPYWAKPIFFAIMVFVWRKLF